jgi:predicted phage terminase large subunit-like protein
VMFPVWGWIKAPPTSWIFAAYGQSLVRRDADASRKLLQSAWFTQRWGDRVTLPTVAAVDLIKNAQGGFRLGTTPGGEVTGFHANVQVVDDPNKPEELTKVAMEDVRNWMSRTMATRWRRPPALNTLILIMQRLHCDDLSQMLIDNGAVHISLPANFDPARRTVTTWGADPRTTPGELMDPVRLPQVLIDKMRKDLGGINAAAQLDQSPVPEGGAVFKKEHLRFWSTDPKSVHEGVTLKDGSKFPCVSKPASVDQEINSWDCAFKDEETSDYVAGGAWARVGSSFFLMDQIHGHFSLPATCVQVVTLRSRRPCSAIIIEDKANGPAVIQTLSKAISGLIATDPKGGKFSRASSASAFFEAHNVFLPDPSMSGFEWVETKYLPELLSFPRARHDDQVDQTSQALLFLQERTSYLSDAMTRVRKMWGME